MTLPDDIGQMPTGDYSQIQDLCDQLEQAWKDYDKDLDSTCQGVDLTTLMSSVHKPLRLSTLYELIKTEMPFRLENSLPWELEHYVQQYPELGGLKNLSPRLIYEEYLVRKGHGLRVVVSAYKKRFPDQFTELEKLMKNPEDTGVTPLASAGKASGGAEPSEPGPFLGLGSGHTLANQYVVQKRLGGGAYGEVWKVLDTKGGIEKALKVIMHPLETEEAKGELQALEKIKNLESPFILRTDSFWVEQGRLMIVMELARGGSLRDCLKNFKKDGYPGIAIEDLLRYIREAADALDYLHGEQLVHRDIKPDNILLVGNHAKVADMGLAKLLPNDRSVTTNPLGSAPYMAPEVWRERVSYRSDQYSLVVSYAEMRQGQLPYKGKKLIDFFEAHLSGDAQLDAALMGATERDIILKGLSRDPAQRFISCLDFVEALEEAVPVGPRRPGHAARPKDVGKPDGPPPSKSAPRTAPAASPHSSGLGVHNPAGSGSDGAQGLSDIPMTETPRDTGPAPAIVPPAPPQSEPPHAPTSADSAYATLSPGYATSVSPSSLPKPSTRHPRHEQPKTATPSAPPLVSSQTPLPPTSVPRLAMPGMDAGRKRSKGRGQLVLAFALLFLIVGSIGGLVGWMILQPHDEPVAKLEPKINEPDVIEKKTANKIIPETKKTEPKEDEPKKVESKRVDPKIEDPIKLQPKTDTLLGAVKKLIDGRDFESAAAKLREAHAKIAPEQKEAYYKLYGDLAGKYLTGDVKKLCRADLEILKESKEKLYPQAMAKYIRVEVVPTWPDQGGWKQRFDDCRDADPTDLWVQACIHECLAEYPQLVLPPPKIPLPPDSDISYVRYVQAVTADPGGSKAATTLEKIDFARESWFAVGKRPLHAANILLKAAAEARNKNGFYDNQKNAGQALRFYEKAETCKNVHPTPKEWNWDFFEEYQTEQAKAIARLSKENPDWKKGLSDARTLLEKPNQLGDAERIFFRLVTADSYHDIGTAFEKSRQNRIIPLISWKNALTPALAIASQNKNNPEIAKDIDKLEPRWLAAKSWLIRIHPGQEWTPQAEPKKEAYDACRAAYAGAKNTKEQAEFLSGLVFAKAYQTGLEGTEDWAGLDKQAREAVAMDPKNPNAHAARAMVLLHQARMERNLKKRSIKYQAAYEASEKSLSLFDNTKNEDWANACWLNSGICLDMGNEENDKILQKEYIEKARDRAREVVLAGLPYPPKAEVYLAYGNGLEDVEMFLQKNGNQDYGEAVKAFEKGWNIVKTATSPSDQKAKLLVALGRSYFRWAGDSLSDEYFSKAEKYLREALGQSSSEDAEAHYWLGKYYRHQKNRKKAKENFAWAADQPHKKKDWLILSKANLCDMDLEDAPRFLAGQEPDYSGCLDKITEAANLFEDGRFKDDFIYKREESLMMPKITYLRGYTYFLKGFKTYNRDPKALPDYKQAFKEWENGWKFQNNLTLSHLSLYDLKVKVTILKKAIQDETNVSYKDIVNKDFIHELSKLADFVKEHPEYKASSEANVKQAYMFFSSSAKGILDGYDAVADQPGLADLRAEVSAIRKKLRISKAK